MCLPRATRILLNVPGISEVSSHLGRGIWAERSEARYALSSESDSTEASEETGAKDNSYSTTIRYSLVFHISFQVRWGTQSIFLSCLLFHCAFFLIFSLL